MPRTGGGANNRGNTVGSHRRDKAKEAERAMEQMEREVRDAQFRFFAKKNRLIFRESDGAFGALLDLYEYALWQIRKSRFARRKQFQIPHLMLMGSAMGALMPKIQAYERGESRRKTKRELAERNAGARKEYASFEGLHQLVPEPVPWDVNDEGVAEEFTCPYTGQVAQKREILASGCRFEVEGGSTFYAGHNTYVVYKAGPRGRWHIAFEVWGGHVDSEGHRLGVSVWPIPWGEVSVTHEGKKTPGVPWQGVKGYSGQSGRPVPREEKDVPPQNGGNPLALIETKTGYLYEADAKKVLLLKITDAQTAALGKQHIDQRRNARLRGGAPKEMAVEVYPTQSETPGERHVPKHVPKNHPSDKGFEGILAGTIPIHIWNGETLEDTPEQRIEDGKNPAMFVKKERRKRKKPEDSDEIRKLIENNRHEKGLCSRCRGKHAPGDHHIVRPPS